MVERITFPTGARLEELAKAYDPESIVSRTIGGRIRGSYSSDYYKGFVAHADFVLDNWMREENPYEKLSKQVGTEFCQLIASYIVHGKVKEAQLANPQRMSVLDSPWNAQAICQEAAHNLRMTDTEITAQKDLIDEKKSFEFLYGGLAGVYGISGHYFNLISENDRDIFRRDLERFQVALDMLDLRTVLALTIVEKHMPLLAEDMNLQRSREAVPGQYV